MCAKYHVFLKVDPKPWNNHEVHLCLKCSESGLTYRGQGTTLHYRVVAGEVTPVKHCNTFHTLSTSAWHFKHVDCHDGAVTNYARSNFLLL